MGGGEKERQLVTLACDTWRISGTDSPGAFFFPFCFVLHRLLLSFFPPFSLFTPQVGQLRRISHRWITRPHARRHRRPSHFVTSVLLRTQTILSTKRPHRHASIARNVRHRCRDSLHEATPTTTTCTPTLRRTQEVTPVHIGRHGHLTMQMPRALRVSPTLTLCGHHPCLRRVFCASHRRPYRYQRTMFIHTPLSAQESYPPCGPGFHSSCTL